MTQPHHSPGVIILRENPPGIPAPAAHYVHTALVQGATRWLTISGQLGIAPDGTVPADAGEQAGIIIANLRRALAHHGMNEGNLVRLGTYLTSREVRAAWQQRRDAWLGHTVPPASTQLIVAGLAHPDCTIEVELTAAA